MSYFLDIIIPQYKENDDVVRPLLNSICLQKNVNFDEIGIRIINDGSDVLLSDSLLQEFKNLNITYLKNEKNLGQGKTEQKGIDTSEAEYITFVDADDELMPDSLQYAISLLKKNHFELLLSHFLEEENGKLFLHKIDLYYYLHGVFMKREYLKKNNIRFNERMRYCEDSYFTKILFMTAENPPVLNKPVYLWKENKKSVMRESSNLIMKLYPDLFICVNDAYEWLENRQQKTENKYYLLSGICDLFIKLESQYFDKEKKEKAEDELSEMILKYKDVFQKLKDEIKEIYDSQLEMNKAVFRDITVSEDFEEYLKRMEVL